MRVAGTPILKPIPTFPAAHPPFPHNPQIRCDGNLPCAQCFRRCRPCRPKHQQDQSPLWKYILSRKDPNVMAEIYIKVRSITPIGGSFNVHAR